jgi:hypothetical protein
MPLAVGYIRLSSKRQCTPEAKANHRAGIQAYIKSHPEHELRWLRDYEDWGLSGWSESHRDGQFGAMKRDIASGELPPGTWIIVRDMDRLGRDDIHRASHELSGLLVAKMTIVTVMDGHIHRGGTGDLSRQMMDLMYSLTLQGRSNEESEIKSRRRSAAAAKARTKALADKTIIRGACPAWLRIEGDRHVVIDDAALLVRRVYQMFVSGLGYGKVARTLNSEGVASIGRSGEWSSTYVRLLLSNRAVIGEAQFGKRNRDTQDKHVLEREAIEGYYPPIISMELWQRAQRVSADRTRFAEAGNGGMFKQRDGTPNLLAGIARCGSCGGPMIRHIGHKGRAYLRCDSRVQRRDCPNSSHVRLLELEQHVLVRTYHALSLPAPAVEPKPELEGVRGAIGWDERGVERLLGDVEDEEDAATRRALRKRIGEIESRIAANKTKLAEAEWAVTHWQQDTYQNEQARLIATISQSRAGYDAWRLQVAAALRRVVDKLTVNADKSITLELFGGRYAGVFEPYSASGVQRFRPLHEIDTSRVKEDVPSGIALVFDEVDALLFEHGAEIADAFDRSEQQGRTRPHA